MLQSHKHFFKKSVGKNHFPVASGMLFRKKHWQKQILCCLRHTLFRKTLFLKSVGKNHFSVASGMLFRKKHWQKSIYTF
jgi:hypothetical protein